MKQRVTADVTQGDTKCEMIMWSVEDDAYVLDVPELAG